MEPAAPVLVERPCPLCGWHSDRALLGPFPVKLCSDEDCRCCWGAWSGPALWLADRLQAADEDGWLFYLYSGSYFRALWNSLRS